MSNLAVLTFTGSKQSRDFNRFTLVLGVLTVGIGLLRSPVQAADAKPTPQASTSADPNAPAEYTVTTNVLRPADKVPPLGANDWGRCGAVEWAANNFVHNPGNEPIYWRNLHRVKECGPDWLEIDGPGTSWWDLWASGLLSGANVRLYRIVDKDGQPLPLNKDGSYLDLTKADHVILVGKTQVLPAGVDKDYPDGGWVANRYANVHPNAFIRHGNLSCTDNSGVENGRTYWYTVVALGPGGVESDIANEASAAPQTGTDSGPHILVFRDGELLPAIKSGTAFQFEPKLLGGTGPFTWAVVDDQDQSVTLPEGLKLDAATGSISGKSAGEVQNQRIVLKVTDSKGQSDKRAYVFTPPSDPAPTQDKDKSKDKPQPPKNVKAVAGDGCATITWEPSPSSNVIGYRIKRSTAPAEKQETRVHLAKGAPELKKWDYAVFDKKFNNFDMKFVNSRIRGMGNAMNAPGWYWQCDPTKTSFTLVPHPQPIPAEMIEPGETCMQITAQPGEQSIFQYVFIGTKHGNESLWYGQLEPGKKYRLEVWLRQEGLAKDGEVTFGYGRGYPDLKTSFPVTGEWKKYTFDFTGPERPADPLHFGHTFTFTGPGKLWMDNCRVFRVDKPEDADQPYTPGVTVLDELMRSQPEKGPKGAHRIWFLHRNATLAALTSWYANSNIDVNWRTNVGGTMAMTLPMALTFDLATGPDPKSRMIPWLVLQHVLHSEEDWQGLIEYLAAPYDPKTDSPDKKPWAYKRYLQRGVGTPWTDEFANIVIEFGNETWHNGVFPDWIGFRTFHAVHQGGPEYGFFTRYLVENMKKSPYWQAQNLDNKIRFDLGGNYQSQVDKDGTVRGYGEEAMQSNPHAALLGHANYVGPKWETGDYSARTYDDHGIQECLLSYVSGTQANQTRMNESQQALAKTGRNYDIAAYEGGPGGYALPGQAPPEQVETNEKYGKSLAQAVGALDCWLDSYRLGWTWQCFLGYGQGNHWNSHTNFANGFQPQPAWQALAMRNRFASGDLMGVEEKTGPTIARKKDVLPLIGVYALRDGNQWSVFVLSRKLDGKHDHADFGDGFTPVTLHLPFAQAGKITLHKLVGNPRATNREKENVSVQSQDLPPDALHKGTWLVNDKTGGGPGGMPPGTVFLYVFENVTP